MAGNLIVLNIGLSAPTFMKAKPLSHVERLAIMRKRLPLFMSIHMTKQEIVPRHVYGGEPVAIVYGKLSSSWQVPLFEMLVEMEQDCCAMLDYATNKGELFGPYANHWGQFDRKFFVM